MNDEVLKLIKETAAKEANTDREDFIVDDVAGGNVDDAYSAGCDDGEIWFARTLLKKLGQ
jgi:hypothetical protein